MAIFGVTIDLIDHALVSRLSRPANRNTPARSENQDLFAERAGVHHRPDHRRSRGDRPGPGQQKDWVMRLAVAGESAVAAGPLAGVAVGNEVFVAVRVLCTGIPPIGCPVSPGTTLT